MTALLGGSVLLIAVSAATLVYGWLNAEDTFIWGSIVATAIAAILVVAAYIRSSREPAVVTSDAPSGPERAPGPAGAEQDDRPPPTPAAEQPTQAQPATGEGASAAAVEENVATAAMPAATGPAEEPAEAEAPGETEQSEVVGVSSTKKFHKPDCRYAGAGSAEPMSRADAETHGFEPCGVCKP